MRHGKKFNHLGRKKGHRKALLKNLSIALIEHKRINTTLAKAKALRKFIEPLITKSKLNTTHSRRVVFSYLQNKEAIKELFDVIADKVASRPGGYVRIIKTGFRKGDGAEMAMIELVDFNEVLLSASEEGTEKRGSRRRRRRGGSRGAAAGTVVAAQQEEVEETIMEEAETVAEEVVEEIEVIEEKIVEKGDDPELDKLEAKTDDDEPKKS